jgi:anti-anti-sigma factor
MTTIHDISVVMIPQRFDANNAPCVESELKAILLSSPKKMILDFSRTDYIASAGLRVLLVITRDLMKTGGLVALVELRPTVHKVFDMAGFTSIFMICISREEAIRKMK